MRFTKEKEMKDGYWNNIRKNKTKFLWLPVTIDGETRWLEIAIIEYKIEKDYAIFSGWYYYWKPFSFINK